MNGYGTKSPVYSPVLIIVLLYCQLLTLYGRMRKVLNAKGLMLTPFALCVIIEGLDRVDLTELESAFRE